MNKFVLFVVMALASSKAYALPKLAEVQQKLNTSANVGPAVQMGYQVVANKVQLLKCKYDYAKQGGAISSIVLKAVDGSDCELPANAIVVDALIDVISAPTSGGSATIAVGTGKTTTDVKTATAIASFTGLMDGVPVSTAATAIKMTAAVKPKMTIATAPLTGGKFNVYLEFVLGD